jgi:tetratricopeptide (TPR) repeat protein
MKRLVAVLLVLSLSVLAGYRVLTLWRGTRLSLKNPSREDLLQSIRWTPSNPNPYYGLGLYHQWNIERIDLQESLHSLEKAVDRSPLNQRYWLDLAKVLNRMGQRKASEQALEKAVFLFPTGYTGRWTAGNLLLQQGALQKALPHFAYILAGYPEESNLVYEILFRVTRDQGFILDKVIPGDLPSLNRYLSYLYEIGDKETAVKAWARKTSLGLQDDRKTVLRHVDFLIDRKAFAEAFQVWKARLREEGLPAPSDRNLITDGGFEREELLGAGFDWRMIPVPGASISFDASAAFEGKRSLKIVFDGKENIDFQHLYQYVSWKPDRDYLLTAHMRTKEMTTKSGIKVEVLAVGGTGPALQVSSESLTGDNGWKELAVAFHTPARSEGGIVRVRRERTDKFDRFLSGAVWLDDLQLVEK